MKTYYEILGVEKEADKAALKSAYRRLIKQFHPDANPDGGKIFEEISRAYSVLANPERRAEYDNKLRSASKSVPNGGAGLFKFRFREFREWLFSLAFVKSLFLRKRVATQTPKTPQVDPAILALDTSELLKRVVYSNNVHVQTMAVRALLAKDPKGTANDLIRILYSNVGEDVKVAIAEGVGALKTACVQKALSEVYEMERSLKVKKAIRAAMQGA